jgi:coniferyl-aldehyde dehydrogenase
MTITEPTTTTPDTAWSPERLEQTLKLQRAAARAEGHPSAQVRQNRLDRLSAALLSATDELTVAISQDFGNRPAGLTQAAEIAVCAHEIARFRRNVARWMKQYRPQPKYLRLSGIRAWVEPTPLGVVGIYGAWNFPVVLAIQPVAAAIAAGNRVMLKMSETTPRTAEVLHDTIAARFSQDELVVVTGGPEVGASFSTLPLDHIFFTGGAAVGSKIAQAAAQNLVPVTLELGGKNPTVVGRDVNLTQAASRIAHARLANSGQFCLSPDYVFVPRESEAAFLAAAEAAFRHAVPTILDNSDYTSIVNRAQYERIMGLIADAEGLGALVVQVAPAGESFPSPETRRIPPTLLARLRPEMAITSEEVFGPVLSVMPYDTVEDVVDYINDRPAPLAAYWYGSNSRDFQFFKINTRSGGITRNAFALHAALDDLPFGGVGRSGTGYYHGKAGFDTFSHLRSVAVSPRLYSPVAVLSPPFSPRLQDALAWMFARQGAKVHRRLNRASVSFRAT